METCPKCGKPESSWEGRFCGKCEAEFQAEEAAREKEEYREASKRFNEDYCPTFAEWRRARWDG